MMMDDELLTTPAAISLFDPGRNCWRGARAEKLALIVDGADYFKTLRSVMISARQELLLIGWDFDFEIEMLPGESDAEGCAPDGFPNRLGEFLEAVVGGDEPGVAHLSPEMEWSPLGCPRTRSADSRHGRLRK